MEPLDSRRVNSPGTTERNLSDLSDPRLEVHHRSDLDAPILRHRQFGGDLDRFVMVAGFDENKSTELFGGLSERAVGC